MKKAILSVVCIAVCTISAFAATPEEVKKETPKYDKAENVIQSIIAQYPGKVVFVDFWATFCKPCIQSMETIKPLKPWMEENGIVKVYIAAPNSDAALWEKMIGDIGGNHYWLTKEEWKAMSNKYEITSIPTYMIFDGKGVKVFQEAGFPGNDRLKEEFQKVL